MVIQIAALAWIFLDERPGVPELSGILFVSVGAYLTQLAGGRGTRTAESPSGTTDPM
jgi:drug/metabolite transporter (DMT)-like permease